MSKVIRFPHHADIRKAEPVTSRWEWLRALFRGPRKAKVFKIKNATHWKLEQVRWRSRGAL